MVATIRFLLKFIVFCLFFSCLIASLVCSVAFLFYEKEKHLILFVAVFVSHMQETGESNTNEQ